MELMMQKGRRCKKRKRVCSDLTRKDRSSKKKHMENNVNNIISKIGNHITTNIYECRRGQTLTSLIQGTTKYSKMKQDHNIHLVWEVLLAWGLNGGFDAQTN
eukprot:12983733-Ditylum_brightwellii.AAC.1